VALDYYGSKYVLLPLGGNRAHGHDPDSFPGLIDHLTGAQDFINANGGIGGEPARMRDDNIEVFSASAGGSVITGDGGGGGGCFIATAAYGSPLARDVRALSAVRDQYLLRNSLGRAFISLYYKHAPKLADLISKRPFLKSIVRTGLRPLIAASRAVSRTK
jgi:hypothetical protein